MVDARRLRGVELFAGLTDEQLSWIATQGSLVELADGAVLFEDGDEGRYFYVFLEGELLITKVINGEERVLTKHMAHPGGPGPDGKPTAASQYTGELPMLAGGGYVAKATAIGPTEAVAYDRQTFLGILARCPQICDVLLPVLAWRIRSYERQSSSSAMLEGLGRLAGGLMHELNNPAAAAARAIGALTAAVGNMAECAMRWGAQATDDERSALATLIAGDRLPMDPIASCDAFDEIAEILASRGVKGPTELACVLADSRVVPGQLRLLPVRPEAFQTAVSFLAYSLQTHEMIAEAAEATRRIEALVADAKTYAEPGGAPRQDVKLAEGLDAVLSLFAAKLSGVSVLRDYADIPPLPAYGSELNQVWSNLIDNAVEAMGGAGELRLRIFQEGGAAVVEIGDNGPGIPSAILPKLFQPFFTTKDIGKGTGLGLYISREIIVHRHNGSIGVSSIPGETRFSVRLPLS